MYCPVRRSATASAIVPGVMRLSQSMVTMTSPFAAKMPVLRTFAMHLSSFLGRPVDLPVDEDLYYEELMKRVAVSRRKDGVKTAVADTKGSYSGT